MKESIRRLAGLSSDHDEQGQGLAEYALILALIAIVAILAVVFFGDSLSDLLSYIGSEIEAATG